MTNVTHEQTTIFSDGSTFDYVNGYRSNGAAPATRDRVAPRITKTYAIFTTNRVLGSVISFLFLAVIFAFVALFFDTHQVTANKQAFEDGINKSGQVEVVKLGSTEAIVKDVKSGSIFRCDVTYLSGDRPQGLAFCAGAGNPATFTVDLPYDRSNPFSASKVEKK